MTNSIEINAALKELTAEFMRSHPNLIFAKVPTVQSKCYNLCKELKRKLNILGPSVKDIKTWQKVYKHRFSFNSYDCRYVHETPDSIQEFERNRQTEQLPNTK
ncbi:uncharacterized protein LOC110118353 [Ceratitis capitata]|uniref:uncharacterized protein LOC110118353 n=1 Tax=Ceratitis capitata TaxID=7213 RepID=UPI000A1068A6|nr:uncharacterized protein LOC110118353 [Ceratitis capitata]